MIRYKTVSWCDQKYLKRLFAGLFLVVCFGCSKGVHIVELQGDAARLRLAYHTWEERGRPRDFQPSDIIPPGNGETNFVFTNVITASGHTYHCRFGMRKPDYWPKGTLAITEEGDTLWLRDRDGKVTVSPESKWTIEP